MVGVVVMVVWVSLVVVILMFLVFEVVGVVGLVAERVGSWCWLGVDVGGAVSCLLSGLSLLIVWHACHRWLPACLPFPPGLIALIVGNVFAVLIVLRADVRVTLSLNRHLERFRRAWSKQL